MSASVDEQTPAVPISPEEFAQQVRKACDILDTELTHIEADRVLIKVLRSLGYGEGCDIYDEARREFWYA